MSKILLINWDNYPNIASGGVYAWAKTLVEGLYDFEFVVFNCVSNPNVNSSYTLPSNVIDVIELPLYGSLRPEEFLKEKKYSVIPRIISKHRNSSEEIIEKRFKRIFAHFVEELTSTNASTAVLADLILELHSFFQSYDVKSCMESAVTFNTFANVLKKDIVYSKITVSEACSLYSFIQRIMLVISASLPEVELVHSSNAWFPAFAGISLKKRFGTTLIATEHGVAFKDLLLHHRLFPSTRSYSALWKAVLTNIIKTVYDSSDLVTSVCEANTEITKTLGTAAMTTVCYNGIDHSRFKPNRDETNQSRPPRPTVVFVGRIELLKDVLNLIQAVFYVKQRLPDVLCDIYGTSNDPSYAKECINLVSELKLQDNVRFMGSTSKPEQAYNSGDIVVLSSVREGFPYTVIEAMSCGKVVVATDVGGVSEALANCGLLVKSRHPLELSKAIVRALTDTELRMNLERRALNHVHRNFTLDKSITQWREIYNEMLPKQVATGDS